MSYRPSRYRDSPHRPIETIDGASRYLRADAGRMQAFYVAFAAFHSLCRSHDIDPSVAWSALHNIHRRAAKGIDPLDARPGWEIANDRKGVKT